MGRLIDMAQKIKAILWDNDGVLVDTEKLYYQANLIILEKFKIELNQELYRKHFLVEGQGLLKILGNLGYKTNQIEEIREQRNNLYSDLLRSGNSLIPGVLETLNHLKKNYRMGIVTGSRKDHFQIIHNNTNIIEHMEFVIAQGDYTDSKPHPDPYLEGIKRLKLSAENCLAIEDTERGLISAKSAGLNCWVIPNQQSKNSDFSKADRILDNIKEIVDILS